MNQHMNTNRENYDADVDGAFFCDEAFLDATLSKQEEMQIMQVVLADLSDAKYVFSSLSMSKKVLALRYMLSQRILITPYLAKPEKNILNEQYAQSIGSLCSTDENGRTHTIALSGMLITRLLYIVEDLSRDEFHQLQHQLIPLHHGYIIVMDVIFNRLTFHQNHE